MKKNIFFLIFLATIIFTSSLNVKAASTNFYEAEYIKGIWMNKSPKRGNNTIYYQTARFFRRIGTNDFAYCIEPFSFFEANAQYEATINPNNLTQKQKERISLIAHFGYGYQNHTEEKWYAITQFMIWQEADPEGDYYFTDSLNGKRITRFQEEMQEINNLISSYLTLPTINNQTYEIVENNKTIIKDQNNVLNNYKVNNNDSITISDNNLIINNLKKGTHQISLTRQDYIYNRPIIFYQSNNSQNLVETGDLENKLINFTVNVNNTSITITKVDNDTKTITPSGEAKLEGAIYELYNDSMNKIHTIKIDENMQGTIKNLNYGKYYLKELSAGIGYEIDPKIYSFEITNKNKDIDLILENKVIKKKLTIYKTYGENDNFSPEANISFNIYNNHNELFKTITTDSTGIAEIQLPYGTYTIKQLTTTPGYEKIEPIYLDVKDNQTITYTLKDYKINVPNTKTTDKNIFLLIIEFIRDLLW